MEYVLGADIGSGSVKLTLLAQDGRIAATAGCEYPTYYPRVGWSEQDPEDWCRAFRTALAQVLEESGADCGQITALAPDAATHTAVLLDRDRNVIRRAILWTDQRSTGEVNWLKEHCLDTIMAQTMNAPTTVWTLPQFMWLKKHEPEVWEKIDCILFAKDYLRYRLTGTIETDHIDAMGSMFYDAGRQCWSDELCREFGIDMGKLPDITEPFRIVGRLSASSASAMGLNGGIPVVAGCGDQAATSLGAGVACEGECFDGAGTASVFSCCTSVYSPDIKHRTVLYPRHVIPGLFQPMAYISGGGLCLKWFRDTVLEGTKTYRELEDEADMLQPGCGGLIFIPHFCGRTCPNDPDVKGMFWGLDYSHGSAAMFRAVMESIAYEYRMYLDILCGCGMKRPSTVFGTGGGSASPCFDRIKADVLGMDYSVTERKDTAPFGAALLAGYGTGIYPDLASAAKRLTGIAGTYKADPGRHDLYKSRAEEYLHILEMSGMLRKRSR